MPNWCNNTLTIRGPRQDVERFANSVGPKGILESLVPMPDELRKTHSGGATGKDGTHYTAWIQGPDGPEPIPADYAKRFGYSNWYDWAIANWGCKWSDSHTHMGVLRTFKNGRAEVTFRFETPWGPPDEGLQTIAELFPTLTFKNKWDEEGGGYGLDTYGEAA